MRPIPACVAALALASAAHAKVHVVANSTEFLAALGSSVSGDVILMKSGLYTSSTGFPFVFKSLSFVADAGADVEFQRQLFLWTPDTQPLLLQGLRLSPQVAQEPALVVNGSAGTLWIDRCAIHATSAASQVLGAAASVANRTIATRSSFDGHSAPGAQGATGIEAGMGFSLYVYDCTIRGGAGRAASASLAATNGRSAVKLQDCFTLFEGTTVEGGPGGAGHAGAPCAAGGSGGPGFELLDTHFPPLVQEYASTIAGGAAGPAGGACGTGTPGPAHAGSTAWVVALAGAARSLEVTSPVREGQPIGWTLTGVPGDVAIVAFGTSTLGGAFGPSPSGALLVVPPFTIFAAGVLPASGILTGSAVLAELGPGIEGVVIAVQALFFDGTSAHFGAPSPTLLLDQAF